ncbi:MAG: pilus assembly protein CpaF [Myxococcota bacterium]|jgi:pilus assembly protein CpaF
MLTLTIREKNGEERQLLFEKEEVTIGRAGGSDIVLPRNNISKRHARLVDKHDKVVIVDLRSTNGTYVNGRRITAPELLTNDDKVYIGDFVIRLTPSSEQRMTKPFAEAEVVAQPAQPARVEARMARAQTVAIAAPHPSEVGAAAADEEALTRAIAAVEDAEYEAVIIRPEQAGPPSPPPTDDDELLEVEESTRALNLADIQAIDAATPDPPPRAKASVSTASASRAATSRPAQEPPPLEAPAPIVESIEPLSEDQEAWDAWNGTVAQLVEMSEQAIEGKATLATLPWEQAQAVVNKMVDQAVKRGDIEADVEREALTQDVVTELVGLGPLADLLADDEVERIAVDGPRMIQVWRGAGREAYGRVFSSDLSLERVIDRLAAEVGYSNGTGHVVIEGTLSTGASVFAVRLPVATEGSCLVIRRARTSPSAPDTLASSGVWTKGQLKAIAAAVQAKRNILVSGVPGSGRTQVLSGILSLADADERLCIVEDGHQITTWQTDIVRLSRHGGGDGHDSIYGKIPRLMPHRIAIDDIDASNVVDVVSLALSGGIPWVASARFSDPDTVLNRLALQLELSASVALGERALKMWAEAVDLIVCLDPASDTPRVVRVVEVESDDASGYTLKVLAKR